MDFIFITSIDKMDFVLRKTGMSYNFACDMIERCYLNGVPNLENRLWVYHADSDVTYFGFSDSVNPMLIHVVARYTESTGAVERRF